MVGEFTKCLFLSYIISVVNWNKQKNNRAVNGICCRCFSDVTSFFCSVTLFLFIQIPIL